MTSFRHSFQLEVPFRMKYPDENYNVGQLRSEIKVVDLENNQSEYKRTEKTEISDLVQKAARRANLIPQKPINKNRKLIRKGE